MRVEFVPLTAALAREFYGQAPMYSLRGMAAVDSQTQRVLALFGVYYGAARTLVAFSEVAAGVELSGRTWVLGGRALLKLLQERALPVIAYAMSEKNRRFLEYLGFEFVLTSSSGDILTWSP